MYSSTTYTLTNSQFVAEFHNDQCWPGPPLFNIYINDICKATHHFNVMMYADDTTLISNLENFGNNNNPTLLEYNINTEISHIYKWINSNKLNLNVDKSKFIIFFKHPKKLPNITIQINNNDIEQVDSFNFLGLTLDQHITWKPHIDKISIKLSRVSGVLKKTQRYFPHQILIFNDHLQIIISPTYIIWAYCMGIPA